MRRRQDRDDERAGGGDHGADQHAGDDGAADAAPAQQGEGGTEHEPDEGADGGRPSPQAATGGTRTSDRHQTAISRPCDAGPR